MKQLLLICTLVGTFTFAQAQTVLNEVYTEPNAGKEEFFELYNSGAAAQSVDCFTLLAYYKNSASDRGWYVLDLPALNVASKGFFVGAAANPFDVQSKTNVAANFNWNDANFRNGISADCSAVQPRIRHHVKLRAHVTHRLPLDRAPRIKAGSL